MRIIAAIGRLAFDLEMGVRAKGTLPSDMHPGEVEIHHIESDTEMAPHIIGFVGVPDEEGDD